MELRCLGCGYDMFTTPHDRASGVWICPECGKPHTNAELSREADERERHRNAVSRLTVTAVWVVLALVLVVALLRRLL